MTPTARDLELYLVRHAVAAESGPDWPDDAARPLTPDGASKFRKAVEGRVSPLNAVGVLAQIDRFWPDMTPSSGAASC